VKSKIKILYLPIFLKSRMDKKTEDFFENLKISLANTSVWPNEYLFKFIVPTDDNKVLEVENAFNNLGAVIKTHQSKTAKYTSVSINVMMENPESIINKYIQLSNVEGIISL
jgi:uncharacterized protein